MKSSTSVTSPLSTMSPMKLTPTLDGIAPILEINDINHCWTSAVLFLLHMGGKATELQLVFHPKDWYPWHPRIHERSLQADLPDIFSHPRSNCVGTVNHRWAGVRAAPHCPGFRGFRSRNLARWLTEEINREDICVGTFWSLERCTVLKGSILRRLWWICYSLCHGDQISDRNTILEWGIILAPGSWNTVSPSQKGRHANWTARCVVVRLCDTLFQSREQGTGSREHRRGSGTKLTLPCDPLRWLTHSLPSALMLWNWLKSFCKLVPNAPTHRLVGDISH